MQQEKPLSEYDEAVEDLKEYLKIFWRWLKIRALITVGALILSVLLAIILQRADIIFKVLGLFIFGFFFEYFVRFRSLFVKVIKLGFKRN